MLAIFSLGFTLAFRSAKEWKSEIEKSRFSYRELSRGYTCDALLEMATEYGRKLLQRPEDLSRTCNQGYNLEQIFIGLRKQGRRTLILLNFPRHVLPKMSLTLPKMLPLLIVSENVKTLLEIIVVISTDFEILMLL